MQNMIERMKNTGEVLTTHGTELVASLVVLIVGLALARWLNQCLRKTLPKKPFTATFCNIVYIVLVVFVVSVALLVFGAKPANVLRLVSIISLAGIGLIMFLRPLIPSMPFKIGDTIQTTGLIGKVEAISFFNTRVKTFEGKTFFVPNRKILDDVVINFHYTQTRRIKINVNLHYEQDLIKAKQVLEAVMIADARVKTKPAPVVYVLNLACSWVEVGGRCWVDNADYWVTRCDLMEKVKLRFDYEGIRFAYPQLELHITHDRPAFAVSLDSRPAAVGLSDADPVDKIDALLAK